MKSMELKTVTGRTVTVRLDNGFADIFADGVFAASMIFADGTGDVKAWKMAFYAGKGLSCQLGHAARNKANRKARKGQGEGGAE